jgi:hypothetical protein
MRRQFVVPEASAFANTVAACNALRRAGAPSKETELSRFVLCVNAGAIGDSMHLRRRSSRLGRVHEVAFDLAQRVQE